MAHLGSRLKGSASVTISRLLPSASPPSSCHLNHSDSTSHPDRKGAVSKCLTQRLYVDLDISELMDYFTSSNVIYIELQYFNEVCSKYGDIIMNGN